MEWSQYRVLMTVGNRAERQLYEVEAEKERWSVEHLQHQIHTLLEDAAAAPRISVPANPLIAEPMDLAKSIERLVTGIRDMIERCRASGLGEPGLQSEGGV